MARKMNFGVLLKASPEFQDHLRAQQQNVMMEIMRKWHLERKQIWWY